MCLKVSGPIVLILLAFRPRDTCKSGDRDPVLTTRRSLLSKHQLLDHPSAHLHSPHLTLSLDLAFPTAICTNGWPLQQLDWRAAQPARTAGRQAWRASCHWGTHGDPTDTGGHLATRLTLEDTWRAARYCRPHGEPPDTGGRLACQLTHEDTWTSCLSFATEVTKHRQGVEWRWRYAGMTTMVSNQLRWGEEGRGREVKWRGGKLEERPAASTTSIRPR